MPSPAAGLLGGILGGIGQGLAQRGRQKFEQKEKERTQVGNWVMKGIESGDVDHEIGYPILTAIMAGRLEELAGGEKGKKDKSSASGLMDILTDPKKFSTVLSSLHQGIDGAIPKNAEQQGGTSETSAGSSPDYGYGPRWDESKKSYSGPPKGLGFFGPLIRPDSDPNNPDVMSELSLDEPINGKMTSFPAIVPTLTKHELQRVLSIKDGEPLPASVRVKAMTFARQRIAQGKSPYAGEGEQQDLYPELSRAKTPSIQSGRPARTSLFRSQAEKDQLAQAETEGKTLATERGKNKGALDLVQRLKVQGMSEEDALTRAGLTKPAEKTPLGGSKAEAVLLAVEDWKAEHDGRTPTAAERRTITEDAIKGYNKANAPEKTTKPVDRRVAGRLGAKTDELLAKQGILPKDASAEQYLAAVTQAGNQLEVDDKLKADKKTKPATSKPVTSTTALKNDVKTTISGSKYLDLSSYDVKGRQAARDWANANGVVPVTKEQATALGAIDQARLNMRDIRAQVFDKLPKDASGRILGGPENRLSALFQKDPALGSFGAWREAAVNQVQATRGVGTGAYRMTQQMVNLIIQNDIPLIDDTVATAEGKLAAVDKQLSNVETSIVVRDRSNLSKKSEPATPKVDPAAKQAFQTRLKSMPPALYRDTKTNTYWKKLPDGSIAEITKSEYDK